MTPQKPPQPPIFPNPYGPPGTPVDTRKLIHFLTDGVQPPATVYLDVNDALLCEIHSTDVSLVVIMRYRILNALGEIIQGEERFSYTATPRNFQQFQVQLTEGFLLSLEARADAFQPSARTRGLTRVKIAILRGTKFALFLSQVLIQGYLDGKSDLTWPGGLLEPTASGQGFMRSVFGTTPAAGAEISETVPALARWGLRTFRFALTTSATVANRAVTLLVDDGVNILFQIETGVTQTAGQALVYNFGLIGARALAVISTSNAVPFPNLTLPAGYRLRTITNGLQVGDQYSAPQYSVEEWFDTP